jgi:hypothetical protein
VTVRVPAEPYADTRKEKLMSKHTARSAAMPGVLHDPMANRGLAYREGAGGSRPDRAPAVRGG